MPDGMRRSGRVRRWTLAAAAVVVALTVGVAARAGAQEEGVQLPMEAWERLRAAAADPARRPPPSQAWGALLRSVEGTFHKGLLSATLRTRFEVLATDGWLEVPVLDSAASLRSVTLDGRPAALTRRAEMYVIGLPRPGVHELVVHFLLGQEQERFARRLRFRVPAAGATGLSLLLPETGIEPRLGDGVLQQVERTPTGTRVRGDVNAGGLVELTWTRHPSHAGPQTLRAEARINTLLTVHESLVTGLAALSLTLLEGETDRLELLVPEGLEVLQVEGPTVAQWQSRAGQGAEPGRLTVLLRHLVADTVQARIRFQLPVDPDQPVVLGSPAPADGTPLQGAAGVRAPTGLRLQVQSLKGATETGLRDLPPGLTEMSDSPLLLGFTFDRLPVVRVSVQRQEQVELTGTVVDEVESSSVLLEDGSEVTKVKLHMRNNTRQYLRLRLPADARLTHCLIDGAPVRPALPPDVQPGALLLPLRQSERIDQGAQRLHRVRPGETLGGLAGLYFANPAHWQRILDANPDQLASDTDLTVGQQLVIPRAPGVTVEEGRFIIELAYRRQHPRMGSWGSAELELPALDVDALEITWHVLLPMAVVPLHFVGNLRQYSAVRYDPFRRALHFLHMALGGGTAWAGDEYRSILSQRKGIYRAETQKRSRAESVLATFPLVGRRFRFKRLLPGQQQPRLRVRWITPWVAQTLRWGALLLGLGLAWLALGRRAGWGRRGLAALGLVGLVLLGHFVLGVHRRVVWGLDLGLLLVLLQAHGADWRRRLRALRADPERLRGALNLRTLLGLSGCWVLLRVILSYPLLLSLLVLAALLIVRWRSGRPAAAALEVSHAG